VYLLFEEGNKVSLPETDSTPRLASSGLRSTSAQRGEGNGGQETLRVQVIDSEQPANNDFLLVSQFSVTGALYTCRPDSVGFVNGLPLVVIELKKPGVPARAVLERSNANRMGHHVPPEAITAIKLFQLFTRPLLSLPHKPESQPQPTNT
jgi:type I restriction enzyme R subunit